MELSETDLYSGINKRVQKIKEINEEIYQKVISEIKNSSSRGYLSCIYVIPPFISNNKLGISKIDGPSCGKFIVEKLVDGNKYLRAKFVEPRSIIIDWSR
jgi:hypothetical protein